MKSVVATLAAAVVLATGAFCPMLVLCVGAGDHVEIELAVGDCCGREHRGDSEPQNRDCGACHDVSFEELVAGALHTSPSLVAAAPAAIVVSTPVPVSAYTFIPTGEFAAQTLPGAAPLSAALRC